MFRLAMLSAATLLALGLSAVYGQGPPGGMPPVSGPPLFFCR